MKGNEDLEWFSCLCYDCLIGNPHVNWEKCSTVVQDVECIARTIKNEEWRKVEDAECVTRTIKNEEGRKVGSDNQL